MSFSFPLKPPKRPAEDSKRISERYRQGFACDSATIPRKCEIIESGKTMPLSEIMRRDYRMSY